MDDKEFKKITSQFLESMDHVGGFIEVLKFMEIAIEQSDCPVIEIGTRLGGSSLCFLEVMRLRKKNNWLYTVDPYGGIEYTSGEQNYNISSHYDNDMYRKAMRDVSNFAHEHELNHHHFKCKSEEFIDWVYPNFKQYSNHDNEGEKFDKFSFIFLDGNHSFECVCMEVDFFIKVLDPKGSLIVDDTFFYEDKFYKKYEDDFELIKIAGRKTMVKMK